MEKKIEDYLHLYLGCEVREVMSLGYTDHILSPETLVLLLCRTKNDAHNIFPFLRPLSDMTEEENVVVWDIETGGINEAADHKVKMVGVWFSRAANNGGGPLTMDWKFETTRFFLSKHFDLFDLIPSGLALDATTISKNK